MDTGEGGGRLRLLRDALAEEGERLLRFMAQPQGAEPYEIRIDEVPLALYSDPLI